MQPISKKSINPLTTTSQPQSLSDPIHGHNNSPINASSPHASNERPLLNSPTPLQKPLPHRDGTPYEEQDCVSTSFLETHPSRNLWPDWMPPAIAALETLSATQEWRHTIGEWIIFEERLGFPRGTVCIYSVVLFLSLTITF